MNDIMHKQMHLRKLIMQKTNELEPRHAGAVCTLIKDMNFYLSQEVVELVEEIGGGRDINKPWKTTHKALHEAPINITEHIKGEAMDVLAFCLNICILAGITDENIDEEFDKVYQKNIKRVQDGY